MRSRTWLSLDNQRQMSVVKSIKRFAGFINLPYRAKLAVTAACCDYQRMENWRAAIYLGLAKQQYDASDFAKSRQSVDQALTLEPRDEPSLLLYAKLWIENGQLPEAAEHQLDLARMADVKNAEADYLSGIVYQRWQMPALALTHYTAACDKAPAELAV